MAEDAVSRKISKLMDEGKSQDQAVAIAKSMQRRGELSKSPPPGTEGFDQTPDPESNEFQPQEFTQTPGDRPLDTAPETSGPQAVDAATGPPEGAQSFNGAENRGSTMEQKSNQNSGLASASASDDRPGGVQDFDQGAEV